MLLSELHEQLAPTFPAYARKDLQTAIRVLAQALDCADPQHCSLDDLNRPLATLYQMVETYLSSQNKSAHTIRNTKNNLSRLFRLADAQHLFPLTSCPATPHHNFYTRTRRLGNHVTYQNGTF